MTIIRKVVCGISGGVDSAVAAYLLKQKGYNVQAVFMRNWDKANEKGTCMADHDLEDAEYTCKHLDIPLPQVNFVKEYWNNIFVPMIDAYENGLTPNVDVSCNRYIKFGYFFRYAIETLGGDAVATGHYARNSAGVDLQSVQNNASYSLLQPVDVSKDQTLFLSQISQQALRQTIFPVGHLLKSEVKEIAKSIGLGKIAERKESMGICFIGAKNFHNFINEYVQQREGKFINLENGEIVGSHQGIHYWTIGQRCLLPGRSVAYFVQNIDTVSNNITVVPGTHHPALYSLSFTVKDMRWINKIPCALNTEEGFRCQFRFQQLQKLVTCTVRRLGDSQSLEVTLDEPQRAITKGQISVFYDGIECLGGGMIVNIGSSLFESSTQRTNNHLTVLQRHKHNS